MRVGRWFGRGLAVAVAGVVAAGGVRAQESAGERLERMLAAQRAALASGDGGQILGASRAVAAVAARDLGDLASGEGRVVEAEAWYRESLGLGESEEVRLALVGAEARAGRAAEADAAAEEAVRAEGESARLRLLLGAAMHAGGEVNGTIRQLERAVALEPGLAGAHLALGSAFWELNEFQYNADSLREFGEAVRLEPGNGLANFDLGSVLSQYGRYGEAKEYLEKAAAVDAGSPDAAMQLGMNAWAEGEVAEARAELGRAVTLTGTALERNNFQIRRALAVLSRIDAEAGRTEEAAKEAATAEDLRGRVTASDQTGAISESVGMVAAVSPNTGARRVKADAPNGAVESRLRGVLGEALNDAGTALARERDYAGALPMFREAVEADGTLAGAERNLGLAAFHVGAWKEAAEALGKVVAAQPGDVLAARDLEEARGHMAP